MRAVHPLKEIAEESIIIAGNNDEVSSTEKKLWERMMYVYEFLSRAKGIPFIGNPVFNILDSFLRIPSFYPMRNLSNRTFQVNLLESSIKKGLCSGVLKKIHSQHLPLVTSFFAPAIAADMDGYDSIFCIVCDADLNRVWVAKEPWESRIIYFAPCGKAAQRLLAYGVPSDRIFTTGFPLSVELLGDKDLAVLKSDLAQRLFYLDPNGQFWPRHNKNVEYFLGEDNCKFNNTRKLTITYCVGGAGAQKEIGRTIALSLRNKLKSGKITLNLAAGTKELVKDYFENVRREISDGAENINIIFSEKPDEYFDLFNKAMHTTDILWTKPSELSFYSGLGIPIIMCPPIGSQEQFNAKWLYEIQAGIKQENPEYTDQWLYDFLKNGRLAEAAWSGFLKARKLGTFKILEILETGKMIREDSPILR
ncbi:MAG: hypothetical protein P4L45_09910 [Ignavibacteriaceae bacterium]|nr:hypothetical protein [Ignavibacteriaceae bacterium]